MGQEKGRVECMAKCKAQLTRMSAASRHHWVPRRYIARQGMLYVYQHITLALEYVVLGAEADAGMQGSMRTVGLRLRTTLGRAAKEEYSLYVL